MIQRASQSWVYYYEGEKRFLKILTAPKSAELPPPFSLSLSLSLSFSFFLPFSYIAPFWCHVTNCFYSPVIIFPVEDSHGEKAREEERKMIRTRDEKGKKARDRRKDGVQEQEQD